MLTLDLDLNGKVLFPSQGMSLLHGVPHYLLEQIRGELTFLNPEWSKKVKANQPTDGTPQYIHVWRVPQNGSGLYIPRYYWKDVLWQYGQKVVCPPDAGNFQLTMKTQPRSELPDQRPVAQHLNSVDGDVGLCLPCGWGKSFLALYYAVQKPGRILVVAPTEVKLGEWIDEIKFHLGIDAKQIGHVQASTRKWIEYPIVVTMLKTLATQQFPPEFLNGFRRIICDEVHLFSAAVMSQALGKLNGDYIILSATPGSGHRRKILELHCGTNFVYAQDESRPSTAHFIRVTVPDNVEGKEWRIQKMILSKNKNYSWVATNFVNHALNDGRRVLVLNSQINPLIDIYRSGLPKAGFVIGENSLKFIVDEVDPGLGTTISKLPGTGWKQQASTYIKGVKKLCNPILATGLTKTQPGGMGMDVADLDGGVVMFPVADDDMTQQLVGRWARNHPTKKDPVIVVMVPNTKTGIKLAQIMAAKMQSLGVTVYEQEAAI